MDWNELITRGWNEFSRQGILATDAELGIRGWNRWLEMHSGRPAAEVVGRNLLEEYPELVERGLERHYRGALAGQAQVLAQSFHRYLLPLQAHEGLEAETMLQSAWIAPLFDKERVVGTLTVIEDVTERVQRETELRDSEARYRSLSADVLNSSEVGMFILDADLRVVWANQALERYFGLPREDIIGQNKRELVRKRIKDMLDNPAQFADTVLATYDDNTYVQELECHVLASEEREERWLEHRSQPIRSGFYAGGRVELYYDITERKQAQEALKVYAERLEELVQERSRELYEAQEQLARRKRLAMLGQMAGSVGHELRNPLAAISATAYLLQHTLVDADETVKEGLDVISEELQRMGKIIADLLDFSRSRPPDREDVSVSALVAQALEKQPAPENVSVSTRIPADLPPVHVDAQQIEQVLDNLLSNAYQAMHREGRLCVDARLENGEVALSITDTGCGMSLETRKKIFDPLFTTKPTGIGLGLPLSRNLVEANGGRIQVQSEEGKGSTFTVLLPVETPLRN